MVPVKFLESIAEAFILTFGITPPTPERRRVAALFIGSALFLMVAGILILVMPRLLNFIVAIYLIVIGLVGLGLLRWLHM